MKKRTLGIVVGTVLSLAQVLGVFAGDELSGQQVELSNPQAAYRFYCSDSQLRMHELEDSEGNVYPFGGELWRLKFYLPATQQFIEFTNLTYTAECTSWIEFTPNQDVEFLGNSPNPLDQRLRMRWTAFNYSPQIDPLALTVVVTVTLTQGADCSPRAYWRIGVENDLPTQGLDWLLYEVSFPFLRFRTIHGDEREYLALSKAVGQLVRNPAATLQQSRRGGYGTGEYAMQMNAYYSEPEQRGLYFAALDPLATPKDFEFTPYPTEPALRYAVIIPTSNMKDPAATSPEQWNWGNDVPLNQIVHVVGSFTGDWYDAGLLYRHWALRQSWTRYGQVIERDDPGAEGYLPQYLREGHLLTLYFSPQIQEFQFTPTLMADYLAQYRNYYGLTDMIFMIWPWWWNQQIFLDMRNAPWSPTQPPYYYFLNLPEYTGGGDYVGNNVPERLRTNFPELCSALHDLPDLQVHTTVSPIGFFSAPFDHFQYNWIPELIKVLQGWTLGFICTTARTGPEVLADMMADWVSYTNGHLDGIYLGYGYYNHPCYDKNHSHFSANGVWGGGAHYAEDLDYYTATIRAEVADPEFLILSEGLCETSCSAADVVFFHHVHGAQKTAGDPAPTYDGNNLYSIPLFDAVYHDHYLANGMTYPFSGLYYHNEYFDGSYVVPSRTDDCANTTFDYYPFDARTSTYPSHDAVFAMQFVYGERINVIDVDQAADASGAVLPNQRFLERGGSSISDPLGKTRRYLRRLMQSQNFYGLDSSQPARRFMILGRTLRPPKITYSGMTPTAVDSRIYFDDFFYDYCVIMEPYNGFTPHTDYSWSIRVQNTLTAGFRIDDLTSSLLVLTNWTDSDQVVDVTFNLEEYGVNPSQPSYLTEITSGGYYPDNLWEFAPGSGTVTIPNLLVTKRQVKLYMLYEGIPPVLRIRYVSMAGDDQGDGSFARPFRTINQAMVESAAEPESPLKIIVGKGVFAGGITIPTGVMLKGSGVETIIKAPEGQAAVTMTAASEGHAKAGFNTGSLANLTIVGNHQSPALILTGCPVRIENVHIEGGAPGVLLLNGDNAYLENCTIRSSQLNAVRVCAGSPQLVTMKVTHCPTPVLDLAKAGPDTQLIGLHLEHGIDQDILRPAVDLAVVPETETILSHTLEEPAEDLLQFCKQPEPLNQRNDPSVVRFFLQD